MSGTLEMFDPPTSADSSNATSSPVSGFGATPCVLPAGAIRSLSGRVRVRANLSARQAKEKGLLTSGTCGRRGSISSRSEALQSFLVSRLQARTASLGSTLYKLTWKRRTTPSLRSIYALRGLAPRTSVSAFIGWATPAAHEAGGTIERFLERKKALKGACGVSLTSLNLQSQLAGWPTPMAGTPAQNGYNEAGNNDSSRKTVALCGWPTPTVGNSTGGQSPPAGTSPTGRTLDGRKLTVALPQIAKLADSGQEPTGSTARTESTGQLNPAHSRWLMGLPPVWDDCGVTAMLSFPSKRRRSSARTEV